jgi:hypothetical protein
VEVADGAPGRTSSAYQLTRAPRSVLRAVATLAREIFDQVYPDASGRRSRSTPSCSASDHVDTRWHTRGTHGRFQGAIWLNHAPSELEISLLVMMGSGVRVPASAWPVGKALQTSLF